MLHVKHELKAFTLIEVLLVIIIIGILATMATTSLISARTKAIDIKRINDIRQIQYALDRFAEGNGEYPTATEFIPGGSLVSRNAHTVYMEKIPQNPTPYIGGSCPDEYSYVQGVGGKSYTLTYCLANKVSDLSPGQCVAMPGLICSQTTACACNDSAKACCGYCNPGDQCGGGWLFARNFDTGTGIFNLVVDSLSNLNNFSAWDSGLPLVSTGATSPVDGQANVANLVDSRYTAANVCKNLVQNGKSDWYLPASQELATLCNTNLIPAWNGRLSSTEVNSTNANYIGAGVCTIGSVIKTNNTNAVSCVRHAP